MSSQDATNQPGTCHSPTLEKSTASFSTSQDILVVGEGDFSFASALADAFVSASNIVATSLDSCDDVKRKYEWSPLTLLKLSERGAKVIHDIDATQMASHPFISRLRFDVIIWNLPHAGYFGKRECSKSVIGKHKALLEPFFWNASKLLKPAGEVHVRHQARDPYDKWDLENLSISAGLRLRESVPFDFCEFPGYTNRRGSGQRAGRSFHVDAVKTYKFIVSKEDTRELVGSKTASVASQSRTRKREEADDSTKPSSRKKRRKKNKKKKKKNTENAQSNTSDTRKGKKKKRGTKAAAVPNSSDSKEAAKLVWRQRNGAPKLVWRQIYRDDGS